MSKVYDLKIFIFILSILLAGFFFSERVQAATNLIYNPGLETPSGSSPSVPDGWIKGRWGTNTAVFSYPVSSSDNSKAAQVSITSYTSGDAKWAFNPVSVQSGKTYRYSDSYNSNVSTFITAQFTMSDGSFTYTDIAQPGPTSSFTSGSFNFTVPANVTKVTIFHLIKKVGNLTIDNASLTDVTPPPPPPPSGNNLIANPSLEFADSNGLPIAWAKGKWGTNTTSFTYPVSGFDGSSAARIDMTSYSSGDAKWYFNPINVTGGTTYQFIDYSRSSVKTIVDVEFKMSDGSFIYMDVGSIGPTSNWTQFQTNFTAPVGTVSLTVFHLISAVGFLEVDNYSLSPLSVQPRGLVSINFDDGHLSAYQNAIPVLDTAGYKSDDFIVTGYMGFPGYISSSQVLSLQSRGHVVEAHTRTHPDLTTLSFQDAQDEIVGSRHDLLNIGITPVNYFAYPFGAYNDQVIQIVKDAGFLAARSTDGGYNNKNTNPYILVRQSMTNLTTFTQVKGYIDTAMANKTWVILLFHEVDYSGDQYAVTPDLFKQIVSYLQQQHITPVTISQALQIIKQQ